MNEWLEKNKDSKQVNYLTNSSIEPIGFAHARLNKSLPETTCSSRVTLKICSKWMNHSRTTHHYRILTSAFPSHLNFIPSLVDCLHSPASLQCLVYHLCYQFWTFFSKLVVSVIMNLAIFPIFTFLLFCICLYGLHCSSRFTVLSRKVTFWKKRPTAQITCKA